MDLENQTGQPGSPRRSMRRMSKGHVLRCMLVSGNYVADLVLLAGALIVYLVTQAGSPRITFIPYENLYKYSYPVLHESVPAYAVIIIVFCLPTVCFFGSTLMQRRPWLEFYKLLIALVMSILLTAAVTNCIKVVVGKPRPNFLFSCWPSGEPHWYNNNTYGGYPACATPASAFEEHLMSFPSGHSSVSASGLGFLTFWLWGQTKAFSSPGNVWRVSFGLLPAWGALAIAITRVYDFWHFPVDIIAGLLLGFLLAFLMYRQMYPWFGHWDCNIPLADLLRSSSYQHQFQRSASGALVSRDGNGNATAAHNNSP